MNTSNVPVNASTDDELQAWLDEQDAVAKKQEAERAAFARQHPMPGWNEIKFNFQREIYRKAIGL